MMWRLPFFAPKAAALRRAWLSASLPPEVKMISPGSAPRHPATRARASLSASSASWPKVYRLEGLPHSLSMASIMAARAAGETGVVAALSA